MVRISGGVTGVVGEALALTCMIAAGHRRTHQGSEAGSAIHPIADIQTQKLPKGVNSLPTVAPF
jgi:hypothetical protein